MAGKPTVDELRSWADQLEGEWFGTGTHTSGLSSQQENDEKLYFQNFTMNTPKGRMIVKTGSAPSDADAAINSIVPADILVKVRPARSRKKYEDQAETLSRMGKALIEQWRRGRDQVRLIAADAVVRHVGVGRVLYDDRLAPSAPKGLSDTPGEDGSNDLEDWYVANHRKNPIIFEHRNSKYVFWRQTITGELLVVAERYLISVLEAKVQFTGGGLFAKADRILRGRGLRDHLVLTDVFYGPWRAIFLESEPIFPGSGVLPHGLTEIPYIIVPFQEMPFDDPGERYPGMFSGTASLYQAEMQALTMQHSMLQTNAWRTYVGWVKDGRDIDMVPGQVILLDKRIGEYLEMPRGDAIPPEILQTTAVIDSYIQRNSVAQGPRTQEGTRSAQQVWAIQSIRGQKLEPARKALQAGLERALSLAAQIVEMKLEVPLVLPSNDRTREGKFKGEVVVKPEDINGYWDGFQVSFGRRLDPAMLEQAKALMALAVNHWMPQRVSWELSGLVDIPQEWEDELMRQGIEDLDFMKQAAGLALIKDEFGEESREYQILSQRVLAASRGQATNQQGTMTPSAQSGTGNGIAGSEINNSMRPASRATGRTAGAAPRPPANITGSPIGQSGG